jgi:acyl carrier protein
MTSEPHDARGYAAEVLAYLRETASDPRLTDGLMGSTLLLERGVLDSFGILELVMHIEERFGIELQEADLSVENFRSAADIAELIRRKVGSTTTSK